jgi:hypothetical protein
MSKKTRHHLQPIKKPPQKVRNPMTPEQANKTPAGAEGHGTQHTEAQKREHDAKQRGAGSGRDAIAKRAEDANIFPKGKKASDYKPENYEEGKEYDEGDAAAGKLDYEKLAEAQNPEQQIPMRDRRAYLKDQAEKNEAVNDELNARQVEQANNFQQATKIMEDPDLQRDLSMENATAELDRHTPEYVENFRKTRAEILARQSGQPVAKPAPAK